MNINIILADYFIALFVPSKSVNYTQSLLTTTLAVEDMRLEADYTVTFPGIGEAPSETRSGVITEKVRNYYTL